MNKLLTLAIPALAMGAFATDYTFEGESGTNWNNAASWSNNPSSPNGNKDETQEDRYIIKEDVHVQVGNQSIYHPHSTLVLEEGASVDPNWDFWFGGLELGKGATLSSNGDGLTLVDSTYFSINEALTQKLDTKGSTLYRVGADGVEIAAVKLNNTFLLPTNGADSVLQSGASIDFGLNGSLHFATGSTINLADMNLAIKAQLATEIYDPSRAGEYGLATRILISSDGEIWNRGLFADSEHDAGNSEKSVFLDIYGNKMTLSDHNNDTFSLDEEGMGKVSTIMIKGADENLVQIQYVVRYVPEPATATLSLLALAGLAARRRRK